MKPGRRDDDLSVIEEEAAIYIKLRRREGVPDEKILQELRRGYGLSKRERDGNTYDEHTWPHMTMKDLQRLGKYGLGSQYGDA